ncbi:uncharacterized protein LOC128239025 isoform X2 [Mya arenaria]|uniref:uncharacterized protein LOC128239025 isoform X2 n=1 Tax=Mya arenaria TaxID=6604 RepID=UPI0022E374B0|nr:uncharacterized protein LOC128239025 isoform X2 [Mya arenaria]
MTDCPSLTNMLPNSTFITKETYRELQVSTWAMSPGTVVRVSCLDGLELVGEPEVTCLDSGLWSADPYCEVKTTPLPTRPDGMDEPLIIVIVLVVILVLVAAVIIFVCIALAMGRGRGNKHKRSKNGDTDSMPYSVSTHVFDQNIALYGNMGRSQIVGEENDNAVYYHNDPTRRRERAVHHSSKEIPENQQQTEGDVYYVSCRMANENPSPGYHSDDCVYCSEGQRLPRIRDFYEEDDRGSPTEHEMNKSRRDEFLWRKGDSVISDFTIPRPHYQSKHTP